MAKKRLGKGLSALIDFNIDEISNDDHIVKYIPLEKIEPNLDQPRKFFSEESLNELANSIKKVGILNPIIVKKINDKYKIISGERRYRAGKIAGIKEIPAIVKDELDEKSSFEISLIENLQREDLNPIEEAESFQKLIDDYGYTHKQIAELIGKDRTYVTNALRLLKLSDFAKECLIKGLISVGHCKVIVNFSEEEQINICKLIIEKELSVREVEKIVRELRAKPQKKDNIKKLLFYNEYKEYFDTISMKLNTRVDIEVGKREKGKIIIHFKDRKELEKILKELS